MPQASELDTDPAAPRPAWRRALTSKWFPYLVVLPAGAVLVLVLAFVVFDSDAAPRGDGIDPRDFPVEWSLRSLIEPAPGEIPAAATPVRGGHAFILTLGSVPADRYEPWGDYIYEDALVGIRGWVEADDQVVSIQIYSSQDEEAAREAFASLPDSRASDILRYTVPLSNLDINFIRDYQVLRISGIGDETYAYRLRHGTDDRQSEVGTREAVIPGFDVDVTAIWARIGGVIIVGARNERPGINVPSRELIDLETLVRNAALRIAAFDPATDILPELLEPRAEDEGPSE
jgi:hypothetical protein